MLIYIAFNYKGPFPPCVLKLVWGFHQELSSGARKVLQAVSVPLEVRLQAKRKIKEPSESVRATSLETALSLPHLTSFKVWVGCGSNRVPHSSSDQVAYATPRYQFWSAGSFPIKSQRTPQNRHQPTTPGTAPTPRGSNRSGSNTRGSADRLWVGCFSFPSHVTGVQELHGEPAAHPPRCPGSRPWCPRRRAGARRGAPLPQHPPGEALGSP